MALSKAEREKQITNFMERLKIDRTEAEQLVDYDEQTDRMTMTEINAEMTAEQRKNVKEMSKTGSKKPTTYTFKQKKAKKDTEKEQIVSNLAELVKNFARNVEIVNKNREISFQIGQNDYSLTLVKHRN